MKIAICKCCGHPLPDDSLEANLAPYVRRLFKIVQRAGTGGITVPDIMEIMYANAPDGGPLSRNIVCVMARAMRPRLEAFGVTIVATRGPGSRYYIVPIARKPDFAKRHERTYRRWRQKEKETRVV